MEKVALGVSLWLAVLWVTASLAGRAMAHPDYERDRERLREAVDEFGRELAASPAGRLFYRLLERLER